FYNYVHERPFILVFRREGIPKCVVPYLEESHLRTRAKCELETVRYFEYPAPEGENWFDVYAPLIKEDDRVGVESAMTLRIYDRTPGDKIKTDIIDEVRLVKTEYEIGRNVHACQILNEGHDKLLEVCRPGMMLFELYGAVTQVMMARVVTEIPMANPLISRPVAIVLPPSLSHDPHNFTNVFLQMEQGGPHVSGVAGQIDGYGVELERTFFLGSVPDKARDPFQVMMEGRTLAYEQLKPGANMSNIDASVRKVYEKAGYGDKILHRTGHGFGITGHEGPYLAVGYNRELQPGMLVSIEPGIYIPGLGGFRHSDTVLITNDGYIKLTDAPDSLEELTIQL
ncbi:MAG: aminopeptidase P family protein, partial [Deltaproteobacteria bacterium]|nr:aminopeptidase P family protein [Deltaproteobacteria bacterium]